jgi:galactose mutarotase-like enzyme
VIPAEHVIGAGPLRAIVTEAGATLRALTWRGVPVLDGFAPGEMPSGARGQLLVPWPNRIQDGRYEFGGRTCQAPVNEPERGNAIHGLVAWTDWQPLRRSGDRVTLGHHLPAQAAYPWPLELRVTYRVGENSLAVTLETRNAGDEPCPFGAGQHPYFSLGAVSVDEVELEVPAAEWLEVDARRLPTGRRHRVAGSPVDFRTARPIGTTRLAVTYARTDGAVVIRHPASGRGLRLWFEPPYRYLVAYTGDELPDPGQRRRGIALEPLTCPANAFRSGASLLVLEPGERVEARWGVELLPG